MVIVVMLLGLVGLALIFIFDPTHNFPTVKQTVQLLPGQNTTIKIPDYGPLNVAIKWVSDPMNWVEVTDTGLLIVLENATKSLLPEEIRGFFIYDTNGHIVLYNPTNSTIISDVTGTKSPDPTQLGNLKAWWYMIFGIFEMIIASIVACIKPSPTVNVRPPADNSIGATTGQMEKQGFWYNFRQGLATFISCCCIRRGGSAAISMV